ASDVEVLAVALHPGSPPQPSPEAAAVLSGLGIDVGAAVSAMSAKGTAGEVVTVPVLDGRSGVRRVLLVGAGEASADAV
ncbi:hypothetical protein, partial [Streptococcus suis]|uniref:hypothetical protein n=1 Tax=Streptococcus suis TaxID=1307 RepID=UPI0029C597E4